MSKRHGVHRLAQVNLSHADGQTLIERLESGVSLSAEERHHLLEVVRATQACQQLLAPPRPGARPAAKRHATHRRPEAKAARRRTRR